MRNLKKILSTVFTISAIMLLVIAFRNSAALKTSFLSNEKQQQMLTPEKALQDLIEGNKRFYSDNKKSRPSLLALSQKASKHGQFPKAVILACMDSRSVPELIFDQSIADIFTLRVAGNVINDEMLASFEFATKHAGSKLVVIMGHTQCGAIQAVCEGGLSGNLESLANAIEPAIEMVKQQTPDNQLDCSDNDTITNIAMQNVRNMKQQVIQKSKVIQTLLKNGDVKIVGALHDLATGIVSFE